MSRIMKYVAHTGIRTVIEAVTALESGLPSAGTTKTLLLNFVERVDLWDLLAVPPHLCNP